MRIQAALAAIVAVSVPAFNAPEAHAVKPDDDSAVSKNFDNIGREIRRLRNVGDQAAMEEMLTKVRAMAAENRTGEPSFIKKDTPEYAEYQKGVDELLARMDELLALAKGGKWEDAKVQAQVFMKEHKGRLEAVENQVKEILAEARRDAEHTKLDITKQAEVEAEAIKNRAIAEINRAKDQAIDELFSTLAHQVSTATEQVVGRALTGADQERLIQETVAQFARQKA